MDDRGLMCYVILKTIDLLEVGKNYREKKTFSFIEIG